jgi:MFS transporter, OFA family, oxalate/formate antiporter
MHAKERVPNRWLIATMCTVLQLCLGTVYAWSYFQPLLVEQFRWTNTETSWAFSLTICCLGLSAAWGGINLARIGPRKLAVAGGLLFAAGYALAALALALKSLTLFYLGYGAVAGIGIGLGYVTPMSTVTKWFPDKKGLVTGIVAMGFGLGAFVLSVVLAPILMRVFHQNLALVFAALGAILGSAAFGSAAMLRDPPADYLPSGHVPSAAKMAARPALISRPRKSPICRLRNTSWPASTRSCGSSSFSTSWPASQSSASCRRSTRISGGSTIQPWSAPFSPAMAPH